MAFALFTTAVIFNVAAIANNNLQDLKTGQLVDATPWKQQVALIIGVLAGAVVIPPVLNLVNQAYGFVGAPGAELRPTPLPAPQAGLISSLAQGVIAADIDWSLIRMGAYIGIAIIVLDAILARTTKHMRVPPLAVGLGIYLPTASTLMIVVGTIVGWFFDRGADRTRNPEGTKQLGVLLASGLIVGESIIGVVLSAIVVFSGVAAPLALVGAGYETAGKIIGGIAFVAIGVRALSMGPGNGVEAVGVNRQLVRPAQNPMANIDPRNPPNEFPDIVGAHPTNPILASFRPFIPPHARLRELTPLPLIIGTLLGMVFGASSLYLVLKVGLTVSASIPVAVISITIFRLLSKLGLRDSTILENNIVQTAGSAGESIAFGLGVTMPAIMILGFDLEITRVMLVAILGGLIGILMMIPLRRALIVQQHGYLKYPEGTACAEVLKAAASPESRDAAHAGDAVARAAADEAVSGGKIIIGGFAIGFIYYGLLEIFKAMKEIPEKVFGKPFEGASISLENNPALLGVGYIIGPRISALMMGGGVLSYLVLIPAIKYFRLRRNIAARAGNCAQHRRHVGRADSEGLHSIHRRGSSRRSRHYQSLSLDTTHLAWIERRTRGSAQLRCRPRRRAAHRSGSFDEMGARRDHRLAHRHHDRAAIESAI